MERRDRRGKEAPVRDRRPSAALLDRLEGPPQRWAAMPPALRICRSSARLMRACLRLQAAGVLPWEIERAAQSLLDALEAQRRRR